MKRHHDAAPLVRRGRRPRRSGPARPVRSSDGPTATNASKWARASGCDGPGGDQDHPGRGRGTDVATRPVEDVGPSHGPTPRAPRCVEADAVRCRRPAPGARRPSRGTPGARQQPQDDDGARRSRTWRATGDAGGSCSRYATESGRPRSSLAEAGQRAHHGLVPGVGGAVGDQQVVGHVDRSRAIGAVAATTSPTTMTAGLVTCRALRPARRSCARVPTVTRCSGWCPSR